jgi:hypothetical protein
MLVSKKQKITFYSNVICCFVKHLLAKRGALYNQLRSPVMTFEKKTYFFLPHWQCFVCCAKILKKSYNLFFAQNLYRNRYRYDYSRSKHNVG